MFWAGMAAFGLAMPAIIASLNVASGTEATAYGAAWAMKAAGSTIAHERKALSGRWRYFLHMFAIGIGAIGLSILLNYLPLDNFALLTMPPTFSRPEKAYSTRVMQALDFTIDKNVKFLPVAGLSLALYDTRSPVYYKAYGYSNQETSQKATTDTLYEIGAVTQQFTAAAIMQLVEQEKVHLEDPITRYIPELPSEFDAVTLRHLLTHTAGIPGDDAAYTEQIALSTPVYSPAELLTLGEPYFSTLAFAPGDRWLYSNQGYRLLGLVIEQASGMTYGDYLQERIFKPLEMTHSSYCPTPPDGLATGYKVVSNKLALDAPYNMSVAYAAEGLCSTATDLIKWQYALTTGQVVSPASYKAMVTPATLNGGQTTNYGYGLYITTDHSDRQYAGSDGRINGFNSLTRYYYGYEQATFALLSNTNVDEERYEIDGGLERIVEAMIQELNE